MQKLGRNLKKIAAVASILVFLAMVLVYVALPGVSVEGCQGSFASMLSQLDINESKTQFVPLLIPDSLCNKQCQAIGRNTFKFSFQMTPAARAAEILKNGKELSFLKEEYEMNDNLGKKIRVHIQDIVFPPNPICHNDHPKKFSESDCWKIKPPEIHYRVLTGFSRPNLLNLNMRSSRCLIH